MEMRRLKWMKLINWVLSAYKNNIKIYSETEFVVRIFEFGYICAFFFISDIFDKHINQLVRWWLDLHQRLIRCTDRVQLMFIFPKP